MTRPLAWMATVRDRPDRPPPLQCLVLDRLALRLDWSTGSGSASVAQLAADVGCDRRTVLRAIAWARGHGLALQLQRGRRLGDGTVRASEWSLSQGDTADTLTRQSQGDTADTSADLKVTDSRLKVTAGPSQGDCTTPPSRPRTSRPRTSARGDGVTPPRPPRADALCRRCGRESCDCPELGLVAANGRPVGTCPRCRELVPLTGSGQIRTHHRGRSRCPGSLKTPAPAKTAATR